MTRDERTKSFWKQLQNAGVVEPEEYRTFADEAEAASDRVVHFAGGPTGLECVFRAWSEHEKTPSAQIFAMAEELSDKLDIDLADAAGVLENPGHLEHQRLFSDSESERIVGLFAEYYARIKARGVPSDVVEPGD